MFLRSASIRKGGVCLPWARPPHFTDLPQGRSGWLLEAPGVAAVAPACPRQPGLSGLQGASLAGKRRSRWSLGAGARLVLHALLNADGLVVSQLLPACRTARPGWPVLPSQEAVSVQSGQQVPMLRHWRKLHPRLQAVAVCVPGAHIHSRPTLASPRPPARQAQAVCCQHSPPRRTNRSRGLSILHRRQPRTKEKCPVASDKAQTRV